MSSGVVWGAGKMSKLMSNFSERLQESSAPVSADPAAPQTKIDPKLQSTAKAARIVSGKAVQVSSYVRECWWCCCWSGVYTRRKIWSLGLDT